MLSYLDIGVVIFVKDETLMLVLNTRGDFEEANDSLQEKLMEAFAQMKKTTLPTGRIDGMLLRTSTNSNFPTVHAMWSSARGGHVRVGIVYKSLILELTEGLIFEVVSDRCFAHQFQSAITQTQPVGNTLFDRREIGIRALRDQELMPDVTFLWYSIEKQD